MFKLFWNRRLHYRFNRFNNSKVQTNLAFTVTNIPFFFVSLLSSSSSAMRFAIILIALFVPPSFAFVPATVPTTSIHCITMTTLNMHRREVLTTGFLGMLTIPVVANASSSTFFYDEKIEQVNEPSQMATDGRVDLNSAFVVSCEGSVWTVRSIFFVSIVLF